MLSRLANRLAEWLEYLRAEQGDTDLPARPCPGEVIHENTELKYATDTRFRTENRTGSDSRSKAAATQAPDGSRGNGQRCPDAPSTHGVDRTTPT